MPYNFRRTTPAPTPNSLMGHNVHGNARIEGAKLYPRMMLFAKEFTKDFSIKRAAIRAGYAESGAYVTGFTLLRRKDIQELVNTELAKRAERLDMSIDRVASYWLNLATVDPRRLAPRGSCRYCWGVDFQHQFTMNEMRLARQEHMRDQLKLKDPCNRREFDELGGDGYDKYRDPNPDCPECNGRGIRVIDLDVLSDGEAALIAGITVMPNGSVTLKMRDQSRAMENLQMLLGYVRPRKAVPVLDPDMTEEQLDAVLQAAVDRGQLRIPDLRDAGFDVEEDDVAVEGSE